MGSIQRTRSVIIPRRMHGSRQIALIEPREVVLLALIAIRNEKD